MNYKEAYKQFRESVRDAVLSGELPITVTPYNGRLTDDYFAEVGFEICNAKVSLTAGYNYNCYYNELIKGLFDNEHFHDFKELVMSKMKVLTPEEKARIKELEEEIAKIKGA